MSHWSPLSQPEELKVSTVYTCFTLSSVKVQSSATDVSHSQANENAICFWLTHICTLFEAFCPNMLYKCTCPNSWTYTVDMLYKCTPPLTVKSHPATCNNIQYWASNMLWLRHVIQQFHVWARQTKLVTLNWADPKGHLDWQAHSWQCQTGMCTVTYH